MATPLLKPDLEHVVLVDDANRAIGTTSKNDVHHQATPLHRGFSVFLFDHSDQTLLQQRSRRKPTWPGAWSNACCGHPRLHESTLDAMHRRLAEELGVTGVELTVMLPDYRYRFARDGVVENEFCPVGVGRVEGEVLINADEVEAIRWTPWTTFLAETEGPNDYSEWCVEEAHLLAEQPAFQAFLRDLPCPSR